MAKSKGKRYKTMGYGLDEVAAALTKGADDLHPALRGQLDRVGGLTKVPADLRVLVDQIDDRYKDSDEQIVALETMLSQLKRERAHASDELGALFESIPDLLVRLDAEGRVLDVRGGDQPDNPLTRAPRNNLVSHALPLDVGKDLLHAVRRTAQTGRLQTKEYRLGMRWYEVRLLPLRQGEVMAMMRDVSAQREAEREKTDRIEQEARVAALSQFAYVASHDLQAPLRAVDNLAGWIEDDIGDKIEGDTKQHLRLLRARVQRMQKLIKGLLEYSRVGRKGVTIEPIACGALIRGVVEMLGPPAGFNVRVVEPMPTIETARDLLERVILNLVTNAIKHHDQPSGNVEISCAQQEATVVFRVRDDGPGIPEQKREKAFQMFQRLSDTTDEDGVGMGLSLIQHIVETAGGSIHVEDAQPRGALFVFSWPRAWPS